MQIPALQQRLITYREWKTRVARAILELERWLEEHQRATPSVKEKLKVALETIERDRLTIAFVSECSRGKTELINALFFSDLGGRLLPSSGGRTTLCPTELLWDAKRNEAYLRLLPVETRARDTSINDLKGDPKHWVHYPLNTQLPEQMAGTLKEILQTKSVSIAEATKLGFSSAGLETDGLQASDQVEIPKWRHAIISFPHPLLKQGLVILDTPGVNALGNEAESSISLLPAVQAALFVLSAETGVTDGDLEIWGHHLKGFQSSSQRAVLVALNKVDLLWEALPDGAAVDTAIASLRRTTAETLGIGADSVFPVSAHKGLVAKIRKDDALLRRSALPVLERNLATRMLDTKHQFLIGCIDASVGQILDRNRTRIASRITRVKAQLEELEQLRDKSQHVITQLLEKTRQEQEFYLTGVRQFQRSREELLIETRHSRTMLERQGIESLVEKAQRNLMSSWTTAGLAQGMRALFEDLRRTMQTVATESERLRKLVRETYQVFHDDFGVDIPTPTVFAPMKYRVEIELLFQEVESYRQSPSMVFSPRGRVIRRFHQQMVSRALVLFDQLRQALDGWIRDTLQPLALTIQERKGTMEKQLENLQRIGRSKDVLQERIEDMERQYVGFAEELTDLRNIHNALHYDPLPEQDTTAKPRVMSG